MFLFSLVGWESSTELHCYFLNDFLNELQNEFFECFFECLVLILKLILMYSFSAFARSETVRFIVLVLYHPRFVPEIRTNVI